MNAFVLMLPDHDNEAWQVSRSWWQGSLSNIYTKYLPIQAHKVFTREKSVNQANFSNVQCELKVVSAHLSFLVNPKVPIEQSSQSF